MQITSQHLPKIKISLHIAQAVLVVIALILTIAVYATSGKTDGRTAYFFALCWATPFILTYQALVPSFPRTRRFCNIYVFAVLDGLAVIFWLVAWAAVADYVVSGKGNGPAKDKSGCENFKYGSVSKCTLSEITIILGVLIMLLFVATVLISAKVVMEYQRTGVLPDYMPGAGLRMGTSNSLGGTKPTGAMNRDREDEEAFDSNVNLRNDWEVEEYEHEDYNDRYGGQGHSHDARQGGYSQAAVDDHEVDQYADARQHQSQPAKSHLRYPEDQDLGGRRPASVGSPIDGDTSYHPAGYGQGGTYSR